LLKPILAAASLAALTLTACEPSTECADPTLLTTTRTLLGEEVLVDLWAPDGQRDRLDTGPVAGDVVLSPDGDLVAFEQPIGEYDPEYGWPATRVTVFSRETGEVTPLIDADEDVSVSGIQWSGDGSQVAFVRGTPSSRFPEEIVAVRADGTDERVLLKLSDRQNSGFAWSSDGEELLVPTAQYSPTFGEYPEPGQAGPPTELWVYDVDTGEHEVVPTPHERIYVYTLSPDGRYLAMSATTIEPGSSGTDRLYVFDTESKTTTAVDRRRGGPTGVTWSGPYLLYVYMVWGPGQVEDHQFMRWDSRTQEREQVDRPGHRNEQDTYTDISAPHCS
jgi:dipeptidyl aminopeptidase/acylaminoacyl peptidase